MGRPRKSPPGPKPNNLAALREAAGLTQEQLAEQLEISHATIQRYEYGTRKPKAPMVERICEILHVSPAAFFLSFNSGKNDSRIPSLNGDNAPKKEEDNDLAETAAQRIERVLSEAIRAQQEHNDHVERLLERLVDRISPEDSREARRPIRRALPPPGKRRS